MGGMSLQVCERVGRGRVRFKNVERVEDRSRVGLPQPTNGKKHTLGRVKKHLKRGMLRHLARVKRV